MKTSSVRVRDGSKRGKSSSRTEGALQNVGPGQKLAGGGIVWHTSRTKFVGCISSTAVCDLPDSPSSSASSVMWWYFFLVQTI